MKITIEDFRKYLNDNPNSVMNQFKNAQEISMTPDEILKDKGYQFHLWHKKNGIGIKTFKKVENGIEKFAYYPEQTYMFEYPIMFLHGI